ncbi:MAG: NAD(P)H-binding protein [Chloroflexota bacterium]|nr:MAG: NAD(P)H-binding protein [Chloroflexota bacterium]
MDVVTGAFGYIGRYITAHLLDAGRSVKTITTHVDKPNPFGAKVSAFGYDFERPERLVGNLRGADTLYNTYWIRFPHSGMTFEQAVDNTRILFDCAARAGIRKIVHISVTHASPGSSLPYYAGKGLQEEALVASGVPYAIVRPTLVFGKEDILVNNIAWLLRKFRFFPSAGDGAYRLQPVYVRDLARIAAEQAEKSTSLTVNAIGPETFTYRQLVEFTAAAIGRDVTFVSLPPRLTILLGRAVGLLVSDVILTANELDGLINNYLTSQQAPNGETRFSDWIRQNGRTVGSDYSSELDRHYRWSPRNK